MGRDSSDGRALLLLALIVLGGVAYRALSLNPNFCDTNSDNLQLKELSNLLVDSSSTTNRDLVNTSFWNLVGSSAKDTMGGLLSTLQAARHPETVNAAVLADPALPWLLRRRLDVPIWTFFGAILVPGLAEWQLRRRRLLDLRRPRPRFRRSRAP